MFRKASLKSILAESEKARNSYEFLAFCFVTPTGTLTVVNRPERAISLVRQLVGDGAMQLDLVA